jgi:predicted nucleotidyltransferase
LYECDNRSRNRDAIRSAFRGKPVERVELFGSAAHGDLTPHSDVDIIVTPSPEASRHDLFIMAAEVEEALERPVDFLIRSDIEAMKNAEAKDLILKSAVAVYVP